MASFPSLIGLFYLSMGWVFALTRFFMTRPPDNVWSLCDAGTRLADCVRDALEGHSQDSVLDRYVLNRPRKHLMLFSARRGDLLGHGGEGNVFG